VSAYKKCVIYQQVTPAHWVPVCGQSGKENKK